MKPRIKRLEKLEQTEKQQNSQERIGGIELITLDMSPSEAATIWRRIADTEPPKYPKGIAECSQQEAEQAYKSIMW